MRNDKKTKQDLLNSKAGISLLTTGQHFKSSQVTATLITPKTTS